MNYNLANYATLRGTTKVAPVNKPDVLPHVSELVYPNVTEISTGNWAIPSADALATEYAKYADQVHDILENHLKVYPYVLISTDPANEAEFLAPETEQDDGIYSNAYANNGKGTSWWVRIGNENGYALDANQTISLETGKLHFDSTNEQLKKRNHIRQDQSEQIHSPGALGHPDRGLHGDNFRNPGRTDRRRGTPVFPGAEGAVYECRRRRCRRGQTRTAMMWTRITMVWYL